jgi:hypothetical protein
MSLGNSQSFHNSAAAAAVRFGSKRLPQWVQFEHNVRGRGRVREPVSVETLRREYPSPTSVRRLLPAGWSGVVTTPTDWGVSPLPADQMARDARRPVRGPAPPLGQSASRSADRPIVEGLSHSALLPKNSLNALRPVAADPGQAIDSAPACGERCAGPLVRRGDRPGMPDATGGTSPPGLSALAFGSVPLVGQPTCREDADLPAGSQSRIAARKAGYAQRNADERPPAGGKPHRHR